MIAAYNNLTATNETGVQNQITATIDDISTFSVTLNSFITNWNRFFNVIFDRLRIKQHLIK